ncbi:catalytic subunit A of V-type proton ATPase, partial [Hamiltosporidium magnivora]
GRNSLTETDKLILDISKLIKEDFLQQNGYSSYDRFCPFVKTRLMLKNIIKYFELAYSVIVDSNSLTTWDEIRKKTNEVFLKLMKMKFIYHENDSEIEDELTSLKNEIDSAFNELDDI